MAFENYTKLIWTSNTKRTRIVYSIIQMKCDNNKYLVKIVDGLPGEKDTFQIVPESRLTVK